MRPGRIWPASTRSSNAMRPRSGRIVPKYDDENLRELITPPYRLIYRIKPDRIDIIAVFHGAQQLPDTL